MKMKKHTALILLALALTGVYSCTGEKKPSENNGSGEPYYMNIMQFNLRYINDSDTGDTHWSVRKNAVKSMINDLLPDVAGLNEARTAQKNDLRNLLPDYSFLEVPNTGTSSGGNVMIMYRTGKFSLLGSKSFYLSDTPNKPSFTWDSTQKQYHACIWGHFQDKETKNEFFVFATHYNLGTTTQDLQARVNSTKLILSRIETETASNPKAPVFVVGDMNASFAEGDSRSVGIQGYLDAGFKNARVSALSTDDIISFNGFSSQERAPKQNIDFIFYKNAAGMDFRTVTATYNGVPFVSDHWPVTLQAMTF